MTLTLALATLIVAAAAHAKGPTLALKTSKAIVATWTCQTQLGQPRTKARSPWKPHTQAYRRWQLTLWTLRKQACLKALHAHDATIRKLQHGLAGTPMSGSEGPLEAAGRRYGISPFFIAAIAGTESSFGAAACSGNPKNAFGLASCGNSWHVPYFPTWAAAYHFMGSFLSSRWPTATTTYSYHGYAACSSCWGAKTAMHMRNRFGVGPSVRYGR